MNRASIKDKVLIESPHIRLDKFLLRCPFCNCGFSRRSDLDNHKICLNLTNKTDLNNNSTKFKTRDIHGKIQNFSCPTCGETFNRWSVFCRHTSYHTYVSVMDNAHQSNISPKRRLFPNTSAAGTKKRRIFPKTSPEGTKQSSNLSNENKNREKKKTKNMKTSRNIGESSEKLQTCRKPTGKTMYEHRCKICLRRFNHSGNLSAHMRVHTNDRPYKCKFCDCRFKQLCHVNNHERLHSGVTPWQCSLCGRKFYQKAHFNKHISKNH